MSDAFTKTHASAWNDIRRRVRVMSEDTAKLEEQVAFLNRQLTAAQVENRRLRDEVSELKQTIIGLATMLTRRREHVSE
jgi:chromosome segregation ATPase